VVKRVIARATETKILPCLQTLTVMGGAQTYVYDPTFQILQGDDSGQRVGRKIQNVSFSLSFRYTHRGENVGTANVADESQLRMLVLRSRAVKTAGVVARHAFQIDPVLAQQPDIFRATGGGAACFSHVDKNMWTVLYDRTWKAIRHLDTANQVARTVLKKNIRIPLPKTCVFREDNLSNSFLTGSETYIVFVAGWNGSGATDNVGELQTEAELRWKDP